MAELYVARNPSLLGMVKIGVANDSKRRLKSLSGTSLPTPFRLELVYYNLLRPVAMKMESSLHRYLSKRRVRPNREFFRGALPDIISEMWDWHHVLYGELSTPEWDSYDGGYCSWRSGAYNVAAQVVLDRRPELFA